MDRPWSVVDFVLIWLAGLFGTGLFYAAAIAFANEDLLVVLGLAGQYVGSLGLFLLLRRRRTTGIGFSIEPSDVLYVGIGLLLQIVLAVAFLPLTRLLFPDGAPPQQVAEALRDIEASTLLKLTLVLAAVLLAPATEELMYRGVLLKAVEGRGRRFVMVVTAVVFSLVHVVGLDPERPLASAAVVLPPIFLLGLALAWVTLRSGRLGPAIFVHSGWNLLAVFVLLLPQELLESPPI
ncbi:MAG: CPBP family intramembrane metalloprotease [Actinobacteria bacterium]|nr:CPBP family intramembrane metalloprotease [Actinomycetota bacterium]